MKLNIVALVMLVGGFLCIYGGIKNLNPLGVVQNALTGKPIKDAAKLSD